MKFVIALLCSAFWFGAQAKEMNNAELEQIFGKPAVSGECRYYRCVAYDGYYRYIGKARNHDYAYRAALDECYYRSTCAEDCRIIDCRTYYP